MTLAVGVFQPRKRQEVEDLRRFTRPYGVDSTFQIGGFKAEDLPPMPPHYIYRNFEEFQAAAGLKGQTIVALELDTHAVPLSKFTQPENVAFLVGPNTGYIPRGVLDQIGRIVAVETPGHAALNSAVATAVVLHDRYVTLHQERKVA